MKVLAYTALTVYLALVIISSIAYAFGNTKKITSTRMAWLKDNKEVYAVKDSGSYINSVYSLSLQELGFEDRVN